MVSDQRAAKQKWTVAELLDWTEGFFRSREIPTPRLDAELLLSSVLVGGRLKLYTDYSKPVDPKERARFRELVERRAKREPVAYLVGVREFYSLRFTVSPAVLIPRPETEHLIDESVEILNADPETPKRVLDLGTGSGCIAITIASQCPDASVVAVDIDERAIDIARRNAADNGVQDRVEFRQGDLFAALSPDDAPFDVVVSNPPYVSAREFSTLMDDVRSFEPRLALVDERSTTHDGYGFYDAIADGVGSYLTPQGVVLVEVGDGQADEVVRRFGARGFSKTRLVRDYGGINRFVIATSA